MKSRSTDEIDVMTISLVDKAGNGYVCAVHPSFFELVIGVLGPKHEFIKWPGVEKVEIDDISQLKEGDTEAK